MGFNDMKEICDWQGRPIAWEVQNQGRIELREWASQQPVMYYDPNTDTIYNWATHQPIVKGRAWPYLPTFKG